ncbi:MAG: histidinol-phosphate transaminase [Thermoguttaceae bacterium]
MHIRAEIAAMRGYEPGEQPRGNEGIKLNTNENPYRASESVYEAIARVCQNGLSRYPDPVATTFREEAARCFNVDPSWILCGNGSDDLLTILTRSFVGEKELLRLPYPSYILYRTLAELQGAYAELVHFNPDWTLTPRFGENPTSLLKPGELARSERLRLVFLPNPNSPSGTIIPPEQILRLAQELPCPLVVDEAYADFAEISCIPLIKKCEKLIVLRTLSKSYALAGLRFGFLVAQPSLIENLLKVKDSYNCDTLSIAGATAAIADQEWLDENRRKIVATRNRLRQRMIDLGFTVPPSFANFTWNTHPDIPLKPIYESLKENGILVRYMNYPGWGDGLRISVGTDEQTDRCVDLIATWLQQRSVVR